jgi:hypothetical protein
MTDLPIYRTQFPFPTSVQRREEIIRVGMSLTKDALACMFGVSTSTITKDLQRVCVNSRHPRRRTDPEGLAILKRLQDAGEPYDVLLINTGFSETVLMSLLEEAPEKVQDKEASEEEDGSEDSKRKAVDQAVKDLQAGLRDGLLALEKANLQVREAEALLQAHRDQGRQKVRNLLARIRTLEEGVEVVKQEGGELFAPEALKEKLAPLERELEACRQAALSGGLDEALPPAEAGAKAAPPNPHGLDHEMAPFYDGEDAMNLGLPAGALVPLWSWEGGPLYKSKEDAKVHASGPTHPLYRNQYFYDGRRLHRREVVPSPIRFCSPRDVEADLGRRLRAKFDATLTGMSPSEKARCEKVLFLSLQQQYAPPEEDK